MSSPKAIAAVTHTLKRILEESISKINNPVITPQIWTEPLDRVEKDISATDNILNLYLYMTKVNQGWSNQDLPSRNNSGDRIANPYLALDLYYVLSSHGSEKLNGDLIHGYGMLALHDNPIIGRDFKATELGSIPLLVDSDLSNQIEQIKITPETINSEEISRLWTMFGAKHRQSAYYKISVVLMRKEKVVKEALPVKNHLVFAKPFKQPTIASILAKDRGVNADYKETRIILIGDEIIIKGTDLKGETTKVNIDSEIQLNTTVITNNELKAGIPISLKAGIHSIQITHEMMLGDPLTAHNGINSNLAAFVLSPKLTNLNFANAKISGKVIPPIPPKKSYAIILNELPANPTDIAESYSFNFKNTKKVANVFVENEDFEHPIQIKSGKYLVRIRVNNAISNLFHDYSGPIVVKP